MKNSKFIGKSRNKIKENGVMEHAQCFMVLNGVSRRCMGDYIRKYGASDGWNFERRRRCDFAVHYHGRNPVILVRTHGDRRTGGIIKEAHWSIKAFCGFVVSENSGRTSGERGHFHKSGSKHSGAWMGGNTGGAGGYEAAGGNERDRAGRDSDCPAGNGQPGDVYVFNPEYFFTSTDSGEYDRLSESLRQRNAGGDRGTGDSCNAGKYRSSSLVLQDHGTVG